MRRGRTTVTKLYTTIFLALAMAGAACPSGLGGEPRSSVATDGLRLAAASGDGYINRQSHLSGGSALCRLPIRIDSWSSGRPLRCG